MKVKQKKSSDPNPCGESHAGKESEELFIFSNTAYRAEAAWKTGISRKAGRIRTECALAIS